jgi:hypothetical protein
VRDVCSVLLRGRAEELVREVLACLDSLICEEASTWCRTPLSENENMVAAEKEIFDVNEQSVAKARITQST